MAKVAETAVLLRLLAHGFNVFGSVFDGDEADWVVEVPSTGRIWKIQVKSAVKSNHGKSYIVSLQHGANTARGARRYEATAFDFVVGYDLFTDTAYVWARHEVAHLRAAVAVNKDALERWDKLETTSV